MRKRILLGILAALLVSGGALAVGNYKAALQFYSTATTWTAATGGASGRGIRWDTTGDVPIAHQNSGTELAMTIPAQTGHGGQFLTTDGTTASWTSSTGGTEVFFDAAVYVANNTPLYSAGNFTVGSQITFMAPTIVSGIKIYWNGAGTTIKVAIWTPGGTLLASGTQAIAGIGTYSINFTTPYTTTAYTPYMISLYDTAGLHYTNSASTTLMPQSDPFIFAAHGMLLARSYYQNGDAAPFTNAGTNVIYPVTPIYTVP
jgi:hypothetical protein